MTRAHELAGLAVVPKRMKAEARIDQEDIGMFRLPHESPPTAEHIRKHPAWERFAGPVEGKGARGAFPRFGSSDRTAGRRPDDLRAAWPD